MASATYEHIDILFIRHPFISIPTVAVKIDVLTDTSGLVSLNYCSIHPLCECKSEEHVAAMIDNLNKAFERVIDENFSKQFIKTVGTAAMKGIEEGLKDESD